MFSAHFTMHLNTLSANLALIKPGTRVLVRVDYNVPLNHATKGWQVANDKRLRISLETIKLLRAQRAVTILISHLGRPTSAKDKHLSLQPVAQYLSDRLGVSMKFVPDLSGEVAKQAVMQAQPGDVLLLENLRYFQEEKANDRHFAKSLASLAELYINDAFSASHRAHASVVGVAKYIPALAGCGLATEVETLQRLMENPKRPFVVVIGGAKISDKVGMLQNLARLADLVLVGGACANTFLKAEGFEIYRSRVEELDVVSKTDFVQVASDLINETKTEKILKDGYIPLPKIVYPIDVVASKNFDTKHRDQVTAMSLHHGMADEPENEKWQYLDIGPKTRKLYAELIMNAGTVFWNGPMGVWENPLFATGTRAIARAIVQSRAESILGGGDTIAAAHHFHLDRKFSFVSAAGGATLEFLGGKQLPGIIPLIQEE